MTISIRSLTKEDISNAIPLVISAYNLPADSLTTLPFNFSIQQDGWFLALEGGDFLGLGGTVLYGDLACIGLMSTDPKVQGRGIGTKILQELLNWQEQHNCFCSFLDASEAGLSVYKRFGFEEKDKTYVLKRDTPSTRIDMSEITKIKFMDLKDLPAVSNFDQRYFGAYREKVLGAYLHQHPGRALISCGQDQQVDGFILTTDKQIGPWVATSVESAKLLLLQGLSLFTERTPITVTIPGSNEAGYQLLQHYGFSLQRSLTHMQRGPLKYPRYRQNIYGQANLMLG